MVPAHTDKNAPCAAVDAISASHILYPYRHFAHPNDVLDAPVTVEEKRAILVSWASDLHAVESFAGLRHPLGVTRPVCCRDIIVALRDLDRQASSSPRGRET